MTQRLNYQPLAAGGMKGFGAVHQYVAQSGLSPQLIDLVYLRVSQINGCAYCIDMHSRDAQHAGVSVTKLMLVSAWREAGDMFTAQERAAFQWAETVTLVAQTAVPDTEYEAAAAVFSPKELTDLTVAIGLMNAYNRLAISFRTVPESVAQLKH